MICDKMTGRQSYCRLQNGGYIERPEKGPTNGVYFGDIVVGIVSRMLSPSRQASAM